MLKKTLKQLVDELTPPKDHNIVTLPENVLAEHMFAIFPDLHQQIEEFEDVESIDLVDLSYDIKTYKVGPGTFKGVKHLSLYAFMHTPDGGLMFRGALCAEDELLRGERVFVFSQGEVVQTPISLEDVGEDLLQWDLPIQLRSFLVPEGASKVFEKRFTSPNDPLCTAKDDELLAWIKQVTDDIRYHKHFENTIHPVQQC